MCAYMSMCVSLCVLCTCYAYIYVCYPPPRPLCVCACACACVQLTSPHHQRPLSIPLGGCPLGTGCPQYSGSGQPSLRPVHALKGSAAQEKPWLSAWRLCSASALVGSGQARLSGPLFPCLGSPSSLDQLWVQVDHGGNQSP